MDVHVHVHVHAHLHVCLHAHVDVYYYTEYKVLSVHAMVLHTKSNDSKLKQSKKITFLSCIKKLYIHTHTHTHIQ